MLGRPVMQQLRELGRRHVLRRELPELLHMCRPHQRLLLLLLHLPLLLLLVLVMLLIVLLLVELLLAGGRQRELMLPRGRHRKLVLGVRLSSGRHGKRLQRLSTRDNWAGGLGRLQVCSRGYAHDARQQHGIPHQHRSTRR